MPTTPLFSDSSSRIFMNGAISRSLASTLIMHSLPRLNPIRGSVAGLPFAEQRIGWQLELAAEKGIAFGNIDAIVDHVQQRLSSHQPQPSLLHGDLWSGNCALGPHGPYIFDPACYWGDRECDTAMLPLHSDQPPQIYDGYQSVSPAAGFSRQAACLSALYAAESSDSVRRATYGGGAESDGQDTGGLTDI